MLSRILIGLIRAYQVGVSSWTPASCRFHPTCSSYAIEAIRTHGSMRGAWLALRRIVRCHPWGGMGYDPVPPAERASGRVDDGGRVPSDEGRRADPVGETEAARDVDEVVTRPADEA